jgi:hypothetical protein
MSPRFFFHHLTDTTTNQSSYTLPLLFDFITLATAQDGSRGAGRARLPALANDADGTATIECLHKVHHIADLISSKKYPGSLGLHPIVYFYSSEGRFQTTSFLGVVRFVQQLEKSRRFIDFTRHRRSFEEFVLKYKHFSNQITTKWGSGIKAYDKLGDLLGLILDQLIAGNSEPKILEVIAADPTLGFLNPAIDSIETRDIGKYFNIDTRSEAFLNVALKEAVRCGICGGYTHINSRTLDHIVRRREGGSGETANAQFVHPFCNSTFKN